MPKIGSWLVQQSKHKKWIRLQRFFYLTKRNILGIVLNDIFRNIVGKIKNQRFQGMKTYYKTTNKLFSIRLYNELQMPIGAFSYNLCKFKLIFKKGEVVCIAQLVNDILEKLHRVFQDQAFRLRQKYPSRMFLNMHKY